MRKGNALEANRFGVLWFLCLVFANALTSRVCGESLYKKRSPAAAKRCGRSVGFPGYGSRE
jgi:hypothetical protein